MVACRRLHATRGALVRVEGGDVGEQRLIQKVAQAKRMWRNLLMMMAFHYMSYDMVMMPPVQHAAPEMTEPWRELTEAAFVRVTRFSTTRFCEVADALIRFPATMRAADGSVMTRRLALFFSSPTKHTLREIPQNPRCVAQIKPTWPARM